MNTEEHNAKIVEQFSKQAIPFTKLSGHLDSIEILKEMAELKPEDNVLDIACGPGLVLCEFAKTASQGTGIDITQVMLEQSQERQKNLGLTNIKWDLGNVTELPYSSNSFSLVITRYSFHHFLDPKKVLSEMYRVCKPNGQILIADVVLSKEKVDAFNEMEVIRDNSHTRALTFEEFEELLSLFELTNLKRASYKVEMELERQLTASFPKEGDDEKLRQIFKNDLTENNLGLESHLIGNEIHFSYPISVYVGRK
jgi:ubiquinone/menaquinone biosynthesis C-methylase UbiE